MGFAEEGEFRSRVAADPFLGGFRWLIAGVRGFGPAVRKRMQSRASNTLISRIGTYR